MRAETRESGKGVEEPRSAAREVEDDDQAAADQATARATSHGVISSEFGAATAGPGAEVPYRAEMERGFGADFGGVRAYTGRSAEMGALGAEAATRGIDDRIAFADAAPTRETVAHELAHVQQARGGGEHAAVQASGSPLSQAGDPAEREADAAAATVVAGGTIAPGALRERGTGIQRKSPYDAIFDKIAADLPGAAEMVAFMNAIAGGDKAGALTAWAAVPSGTRDVLDNKTILTRLKGYPVEGLEADPIESVLEVLGPDAVKVLAQASVSISKARYGDIILADFANAADWVSAFAAYPMSLFSFVMAMPTKSTVTPEQAKQMNAFAQLLRDLWPEIIFERIYPPLEDTTYDSKKVKTRAWLTSDAKKMFAGLSDHLPPAHVQTIVKGFYLGMDKVTDAGDVPLGYGWYTSKGHVVMPGGSTYTGTGTSHGMSGGASATTDKLDHFDSTLLHEVGHGVAARTDANSWAKEWGDWDKMSISSWSKHLFDDAVAEASTAADVASGTLAKKDVLPPASARKWMSQKIAGRDPSLVVTGEPTHWGLGMDYKFWTDAQVEVFIRNYYSGQNLFKYWDRGLKHDEAYAADANNQGDDGRYYVYADTVDESHVSYTSNVITWKVSDYSLCSYKEWFAEQYTEYYRTTPHGSTLAPSVKAKLDELHVMKFDPDKKKLLAPGAADDDTALKKYTDEERIEEYERMFPWWAMM